MPNEKWGMQEGDLVRHCAGLPHAFYRDLEIPKFYKFHRKS